MRLAVGVSQYVDTMAHLRAGAAKMGSAGRWVREVSVHLLVYTCSPSSG